MDNDLKKYVSRSYHKINGIITEIEQVHPKVLQVVIHKGGKFPRYIKFSAYGTIAEALKNQYKPKDRIKIRFSCESKKVNDRWYTDLTVREFEQWKKKAPPPVPVNQRPMWAMPESDQEF